jgi:hypothetical protein
VEYLNYDSVLSHFLRLTGMTEVEFSHYTLVCNGADYVISRLCVNPDTLTDSQKSLCEYAAATAAVYDYSFELCLRKKEVMSDTGNVSLETADSKTIDAARTLRQSAFARLSAAGIAKPQNFAFMGV